MCCAGSDLFRQRRDLKICTDGFIVSAGGSPATLFTAKLCNIGGTGHKALLCQNGRTVYIFQDGKTALCPHFGVAGLDQLLCFSDVINVTVNEGKGLEGVEITEITLHNYNTQGYCAAPNGNNLPYIPATSQISTSALSSGPLKGEEGNCFENRFYIPEHKNTGIAEDRRVYLHIKANVYNTPKEYNLAFTHNGDIHDVLRNYIYIFNIKSIKAEDASLNLDYTVKKWDLISVDVPSFN